MSGYNLSPIAKWDQQGAIHSPGSEGSCPPEKVEGDNPSISASAALPQQGDQRHKGGSGGADATPAMPGA